VSTDPIVLLNGVVHGMEREAQCEILARRLLAGSAVRYSQVSILKADPDLPDGNYGIVFDGHFIAAKKARNLWITDGAVTRVD
jgi:hypothetical protein